MRILSIEQIDLKKIAPGLQEGPDGIWFCATSDAISYPAEGNEICYQLEDRSFWFRHRNACILSAVKAFPPRGPIFDVGGGNGFVSLAIQEEGWDCVVVEPGQTGARNARKRGIRTVICSTLADAGLNKETVPAVGVFDVLEHIKDDGVFLETLNRLLVPDGLLYITVPAYRMLWSAEDVAAGHFRRYTLKRLSETLEQNGFAVRFSTYFFTFLPAPIFVMRSIPSWLGWRDGSTEPASDHVVSSNLVNRVLAWELNRLNRQKPLPFGGSCLVVAQKTRLITGI